ncbi:alpha/beta hydrolase [Nitrogeniibacter mangrovi]|uniref:Alpha/beta hydrolase n=1 Tax=Nitrogeniibacter mangrovi TaxID=2016596 RepID=A0A6C1AYR2_9RHOO|nr:alpha/beta fold hydrolase [Nitrogeniibacter mangrovi]QID16496.1 alpha/beta hydrolase [Nitrogeniibacter mangrovi]
MNRSRFGDLEVIARTPSTVVRDTPLLFVHGAYTAAWCWEAHFLPWFADAGFACYAVSLSGHGHSRQHGMLDSYSIDDYVNDVAEVVAALPEAPILIGHSMGGFVVQKFLEHHTAPAAVLMASVPPQGLWSSALGLMFKKPTLLQDLNRMLGGAAPSVDSVREALFHQPVDAERLREYCLKSQPESHRAIWDMTLFNLPHVARMADVPMLVLGAGEDHLIPPALVQRTAQTYGVDEILFEDMGHAMMLERDWEQVATCMLRWLETQIVR